MAYANEAAAAMASVKPTTATSAVESFDGILTRLETAAERAFGCADKIVGSRPSPVGTGDKEMPPPQHLISQIQYRRDRLVRAVERIEGEIQRIENGLT